MTDLPDLPSGLSWKMQRADMRLLAGWVDGSYEAQIVDDDEPVIDCSDGTSYQLGFGHGYGDSYSEAASKIYEHVLADDFLGPYFRGEKVWNTEEVRIGAGGSSTCMPL